jgi:hypothetical protein
LPDKVEAIVANLTRRKSARPRRVKTLDSTVKALFQGQLTDAEVTAIREALVKRGAISIDGEKVGYRYCQVNSTAPRFPSSGWRQIATALSHDAKAP